MPKAALSTVCMKSTDFYAVDTIGIGSFVKVVAWCNNERRCSCRAGNMQAKLVQDQAAAGRVDVNIYHFPARKRLGFEVRNHEQAVMDRHNLLGNCPGVAANENSASARREGKSAGKRKRGSLPQKRKVHALPIPAIRPKFLPVRRLAEAGGDGLAACLLCRRGLLQQCGLLRQIHYHVRLPLLGGGV